MKHTLESIAKLAGVSRGTVSRVVNHHPGVKESIRKKVWKIIEETNYHPNTHAKSLAGGKTENIGVVVFGMSPMFLAHHIFYEVLQGIQHHATQHSYDLLLFSNKSEMDQHYWKQVANKRKVDGLIVMGEYIREEYLRYYHERELPFVSVGKPMIDDIPLHCVTSDYRTGAYRATKHLTDQGRHNILYLRGILGTYHDDEKTMGHTQALRATQIEVDTRRFIEANADQHKAYERTKQMVLEDDSIDAVFAANDLMAFGAIHAIRDLGKTVPEDIAVVGYDDVQSAAYFSPPLSTIRQNKMTLGQEATELLLKMMSEKSLPTDSKTIVVDNELIQRESS